MTRRKAVEIEVDSTISPNSPTRSKKAVTIFRSEPQIDGPFYSHAMRCWRIQYYERGLTYHYSRESSIYIERLSDAQKVAPLVEVIKTWDAWKALVPHIKETLAQSETGGFCYVTGLDLHHVQCGQRTL